MDFLRQIIIFRGIKKEIFEPIECPHTPFQRPLRPLCMQQLTCKNFKKLETHQSSPLEEKRRNSYERTLKPGTILINDFLFEGGVERVKSCVIYKTKFLHDWFSGMMIWRKRISCKREGMHKCVPLVGRVGNKVSSGSKTNSRGPTALEFPRRAVQKQQLQSRQQQVILQSICAMICHRNPKQA